MIAPNQEQLGLDCSAVQERALQLQFQALLLALRTLYFAAERIAADHLARTERQLLRDLHCVGERLKETNPDNWSP